jgi:hypothetical protein
MTPSRKDPRRILGLANDIIRVRPKAKSGRAGAALRGQEFRGAGHVADPGGDPRKPLRQQRPLNGLGNFCWFRRGAGLVGDQGHCPPVAVAAGTEPQQGDPVPDNGAFQGGFGRACRGIIAGRHVDTGKPDLATVGQSDGAAIDDRLHDGIAERCGLAGVVGGGVVFSGPGRCREQRSGHQRKRSPLTQRAVPPHPQQNSTQRDQSGSCRACPSLARPSLARIHGSRLNRGCRS